MPACTRIPLRSLHPPLCLGMVLVLAAHAPAWAQAAAGTAPSQITPPTLRPPARGSAEAVVIAPAADTAAPPGSDTLFVAPGGFVVVSDSPLLLQLSQGVALPAPHTRLSVTELFALAAQLEQAYVRAGYPLVRVVLPAQSVVDGGSVRFTVVDGFIEAIDVEGLPVSVREPVRRRVQSLVGVRGLRLAELERRLLIAGDTPGLTLRSTLVAGEARGGTKLILDGRHAPITGSLSADNRLSPALQRWQFGPSAALNSVLGLGEQFYATLRTGSQLQDTFGADPLLRILAVGAALPLGGDGLSVAAELTDSQTHAIAAPGATDAVGTLRRITLRTAYPVLRTRTDALTVGLAFDRLEQSSEAPIFGVDLSRDRYTALRGTLDVTSLMPWGARVSSTFTLSGGLGGRDADAASQSGVPLSRQGAEPRFRKFGAALQYSQPLPLDRTRIDLFAAGQTAFGHAMLQSEQFSLEGAALVSGVPSGTLGVDSGAALRAEVQRSVLIDWSGVRTTLAPYVFAAYGRGRIAWPTSVETPRVIGRSHGAGLRTELGQAGIGSTHSLALEWARQASDAPGLKPGYRAAVFYAVSF